MHGRLKRGLLATLAMSAFFAAGTVTARADDTAAEIRALKAQLRLLEQKVDAQARRQEQTQKQVREVAAKGPAIYSKGPPLLTTICPAGALTFKGICITPGGYLELTGIFRDHNLESDNPTTFNSIPYKNNKVGHTREERYSARGSRLSLLVQGNVNPATTLTGYAELDFQGAAQTANNNQTDSYQPRIRQLYGAIDNSDWGTHVLFGQSWSLATMNSVGIVRDKVNAPVTIDQQYLPGFTFARQPQMRIVKDFGPAFSVGVSAENPATTFSGSAPTGVVARSSNLCGISNNPPLAAPGGSGGSSGDSGFNACNTLSINQVPDVVGKAAWDPVLGDHKIHLEGWGMVRDFYDRTDGGVFATANHNVWGGGAGGSALVSLFPKIIDVQFSGSYGNIGRYGAAGLPDATFSSLTGKLEPIKYTQLLGGAIVHATSQLDIYGYGGAEFAQKRFNTGEGSGTGYGNPASINSGCLTEGGGSVVTSTLTGSTSSTCVGDTKRIWQATVGFWDTVYQGAYGKLQWGAQYSYTRRDSFPGASFTSADKTTAGPPSVTTTTVTSVAPGTITAHASENIIMTSLRYYPF